MPRHNPPDHSHLDRLLDLASQSWADGWVETNSGPPFRLPRTSRSQPATADDPPNPPPSA